MSSTSSRNTKNNDEGEVDEEDEHGTKVDKDVADTPVVITTGILLLTSLLWHLSHCQVTSSHLRLTPPSTSIYL